MRTMGGTAHLRRRICRFSRRPSGTEPLIHRSRPEREGGRPQPSAPASGRRVQPEPIGSPELKFPGDPIGLPRTKSGGAMSGRGSSPPRRAGAYPPTLSRGPARQPSRPSRSWLGARRGAGRCAARMLSQAARAPMHEIECVERLALDSLMRELLSS